MADTTPATTAEDRAIDALTKILEAAISPEATEAQQIILRRLATAGDLFPSRVPAPLNITQVGGYLNLLHDDPVLSAQVLASTLGVAGPNPTPGFEATLPARYFVERVNDRPSGTAQPATPVRILVRDDFAADFDALRATLHDLGALLPVLSASTSLPPLGTSGEPDILGVLGRRLTLVPSAALVDPTADPLAVGQRAGAGPELVLARQVDVAASKAGTVTADTFSLWQCGATSCAQVSVTAAYVELEPLLAAAGWHRADPVPVPTALGSAGWSSWVNTTGLVAGTSTVGAEMRLLFSAGQIAASSVRELQDRLWDGSAFAAPVS